ncbi:hypothetical protein BT93_A1618 [Corymbia citriodora subsp. variegata]|nr:hypothetical protein BT93_A1618 [Corymbia citriodora subsp. variegata]
MKGKEFLASPKKLRDDPESRDDPKSPEVEGTKRTVVTVASPEKIHTGPETLNPHKSILEKEGGKCSTGAPMPKRHPLAFCIFKWDFWESYKEEFGSSVIDAVGAKWDAMSDAVTDAAGAKWDAMSDAERQPYLDRAVEKMEQFRKAAEVYRRLGMT